jgi:hypothetical protein
VRTPVRWTLTLVALGGALVFASSFLSWVEERPGVVLDDPVLAWFEPVDASLPATVLIYGGILFALLVMARTPERLRRALEGYVLLVLLRGAMMWVTPLDPPAGMIPLHDPFVERFGPARALTRDLYFSGHVATAVLLGLFLPSARLRLVLFASSGVLAALMLRQRVHYTIDVLAAPFVAFGAHAIVQGLPWNRAALTPPPDRSAPPSRT